MKKKIATIVCALASIGLFADAYQPFTPSLQHVTESKIVTTEPSELKQGLVYVRFLAADPSVFTQYQVHPGVGLGYRRLKGSSAFDISATTGGHGGHRRIAYTWSAPKVSYLHYVNPYADQTMYLGAGMAFGGVESRKEVWDGFKTKSEHREFVGLLGHVTAGVELFRRDACVVISELSLSQPLVPANKPKGAFGPSAELSCGLGF